MTTQDKMSFEERLEEANPFGGTLVVCGHDIKDAVGEAAFNTGARWAREQTIIEVLWLLRDHRDWRRVNADVSPTARVSVSYEQVADWLESKLAQNVHHELTDKTKSEPKVIMKDEIYKTEGDL